MRTTIRPLMLIIQEFVVSMNWIFQGSDWHMTKKLRNQRFWVILTNLFKEKILSNKNSEIQHLLKHHIPDIQHLKFELRISKMIQLWILKNAILGYDISDLNVWNLHRQCTEWMKCPFKRSLIFLIRSLIFLIPPSQPFLACTIVRSASRSWWYHEPLSQWRFQALNICPLHL